MPPANTIEWGMNMFSVKVIGPTGIRTNGFLIRQVSVNMFIAENDEKKFIFSAQAFNGSLSIILLSRYDVESRRYYTAHKYLSRFFAPIEKLGIYLAKNGYIWDYGKSTVYAYTD